MAIKKVYYYHGVIRGWILRAITKQVATFICGLANGSPYYNAKNILTIQKAHFPSTYVNKAIEWLIMSEKAKKTAMRFCLLSKSTTSIFHLYTPNPIPNSALFMAFQVPLVHLNCICLFVYPKLSSFISQVCMSFGYLWKSKMQATSKFTLVAYRIRELL